MKKLIAAGISLLLSTFAVNAKDQNDPTRIFTSENTDKFYQIKMGAGLARTGTTQTTIPVLSIGKRYELGDSAIEVSGAWGDHTTTNGSKATYYSLPKVMYLGFLEPNSRHSYYYGGGLSWGRVKLREPVNYNKNYNAYEYKGSHFSGIFAEGTAGYELHRTTALRTMIELNLSQPMIAESKSGGHPGPTAFLGLSLGF
jgi:hypothetical protein